MRSAVALSAGFVLYVCLVLTGRVAVADAEDTNEAAIKAVVRQFFAAYEQESAEQFGVLWSAQSPQFEEQRAQFSSVTKETDQIVLKSLRFRRVTINGERAHVRVAVEMTDKVVQTGEPSVHWAEPERQFELGFEQGSWRIRSHAAFKYNDPALINALLAARSSRERDALLSAEFDAEWAEQNAIRQQALTWAFSHCHDLQQRQRLFLEEPVLQSPGLVVDLCSVVRALLKQTAPRMWGIRSPTSGKDNVAPRFRLQPSRRAVVGQPYVGELRAADPEGAPLTFALHGAPAGMTIDASSGLLSWTPTAFQAGEHRITVSVTDSPTPMLGAFLPPDGNAAFLSFTVFVASPARPAWLRMHDTFGQAEIYVDRAEEAARLLRDPECVAWCLVHRGLIREATGELDAALADFQEAQVIFRELELPLPLAATQLRLGRLLVGIERFKEAELAFRDSQNTFEDIALGPDADERLLSTEMWLQVAGHKRRQNESLRRLIIDQSSEMAITLAGIVLDEAENVYGPLHPECCRALIMLSFLELCEGDVAMARALAQDAQYVADRLYGPLHDLAINARWQLDVVQRASQLNPEQFARFRQAERQWVEAERLQEIGSLIPALELTADVVAIRREVLGDKHPYYAEALQRRASLHKAAGDWQSAAKYHGLAASIQEETLGRQHGTYIGSLMNKADALHLQVMNNDYLRPAEATRLLKEALAIWKTLPGEHAASIRTVEQFSLPHVLRLEHLGMGSRESVYEARSAWRRAQHLIAEDRIHDAILEAERARQILQEHLGGQDVWTLQAIETLALVYYLDRQVARAAPLLDELVRFYENTGNLGDETYAEAVLLLAGFHLQAGNYAQADAQLGKAAEAFKRIYGRNSLRFAEVLKERGDLAATVHDFRAAEAFYYQALDIYKKQILSPDDPNFFGNNYPTQFSDEQVGAFPELYVPYALLLQQISTAAWELNSFSLAREWAQSALDITVQAVGTQEHALVASHLQWLGRIELNLSNWDAAEQKFLQARDICTQVGATSDMSYATLLHDLSDAMGGQGDFVEAERLSIEASSLVEQLAGSDSRVFAKSQLPLVWIYACTNRREQALERLVRILEIEEQQSWDVYSFSADPQRYLHSRPGMPYWLLSLVFHGGRDQAEVVLAWEWLLRFKGRSLDLASRYRQAQQAVHDDPDLAAGIAKIAALRHEISQLTLDAPLDVNTTALERRLEQLHKQRDELQALLNRRVAQRVGGTDLTLSTIRQQLPRGAALVDIHLVRLFDFERIAAPANFREPVNSSVRYVAFVLPPEQGAKPQLIDLGDVVPIDEALQQFREQLENAKQGLRTTSEAALEEEFRAVSSELYELVFAPLREAIGEATTVYISPDYELNQIPFGALVDAQSGQYLIEQYQFAYLPAARDLVRPQSAAAEGAIVFAGPDYDLGVTQRQEVARELLANLTRSAEDVFSGEPSAEVRGGLDWKPLTGAEAEAQVVREALEGSQYGPVTTYVGPQALEEVFKGTQPPRLLHIATHGYFLPNQTSQFAEDRAWFGRSSAGRQAGAGRGLSRLRRVENPLLRSGLVLAGANALGTSTGVDAAAHDDGWVTAEEIMSLNLSGTDLVVLSACESGLGDLEAGESVFGLQRAFLQAGARTLVTSLFKVPDVATRELMVDFYDGLGQQQGKLESLHQAQREMIARRRAEHEAAHPFFWASFILVGQP